MTAVFAIVGQYLLHGTGPSAAYARLRQGVGEDS
jgi:hypothetical protein